MIHKPHRNALTTQASPHFTWGELACRGCAFGCDRSTALAHVADTALAKLEIMRRLIAKPFRINSCVRCPRHNARVGGAPASQHRATEHRPATAFDIALAIPGGGTHSKHDLIAAAEAAGFRGFGLNYRRFLHIDDRRQPARW